MRLLTIFAFYLLSTGLSLAFSVPEGTYKCSIDITEWFDISVTNQSDFPIFEGRYDRPRTRTELMVLIFDQEKGVLVEDASRVLPNYLFITTQNEQDYESHMYFDQENNLLTYQVDWNNSWYFGSTMRVELNKNQKMDKKIIANITFDDNDGVHQHIYGVRCSTKSSPKSL